MITCPKCKGSGSLYDGPAPKLPCYICSGQGQVADPPEACESCDYPAPLQIYGGKSISPDERFWFCDLCAATASANSQIYPEQYRENHQVLQTICYVGNAILAAIKAKP